MEASCSTKRQNFPLEILTRHSTKDNIRRKGMEISGERNRCSAFEDDVHVFFNRPFALDYWQEFSLNVTNYCRIYYLCWLFWLSP